MPNTYTQIYIQIVFAVEGRQNLITKQHQEDLHKYITFSYSRSQIDSVTKYILNQEEHHLKRTFREEYLIFLKRFAIEHDEKYLFDWVK